MGDTRIEDLLRHAVEGADEDQDPALRDLIEAVRACPDESVKRIVKAMRVRIKHKSWDELLSGIQHAPNTWIPALMLECAKQGYLKPVFLPCGASTMVKRMEEREGYTTKEGVAAQREKERQRMEQSTEEDHGIP